MNKHKKRDRKDSQFSALETKIFQMIGLVPRRELETEQIVEQGRALVVSRLSRVGVCSGFFKVGNLGCSKKLASCS